MSTLYTPHVLTSATTGLLDFIRLENGDIEAIFGRSGIQMSQLDNPTLSIELSKYCLLFSEAVKSTQDDNFGLKYGYQFKPQDLGLLGYIGIASPTVEIALRNVIEAFPMHQQGSTLQLRHDRDYCYLDYRVSCVQPVERRQDAELSIGMFMNLIRHACGQTWTPEQVCFEHKKPEAWREHIRLFDAPVFFDQPTNSLIFKKSILNQTMPTQDVNLLKLIQQTLSSLSQQPSVQSTSSVEIDFLNSLRYKIQHHLSDPTLSLESISLQLGIPSWTLQRRLNQLTLSFSQVVDQVRQVQALYLLEHTQISFSELAFRLGYSELSAFSRAFRRWFGVSPKQWRSTQTMHQNNLSY